MPFEVDRWATHIFESNEGPLNGTPERYMRVRSLFSVARSRVTVTPASSGTGSTVGAPKLPSATARATRTAQRQDFIVRRYHASNARTFAITAISAGGNFDGSSSLSANHAASATSMADGAGDPGVRAARKKRRSTALSASS